MGMYDMELDTSVRFEKIMSLLVGFALLMVQLLLIIYGTMVAAFIGDYSPFLGVELQKPVLMIITVGLVLSGIVTLGAYGLYKENLVLIVLYGVLVLCVFLLQVFAAIYAYMMQADLHEFLYHNMIELIMKYKSTEDIRKSVTDLQTDMQCCGITCTETFAIVNGEYYYNYNDTLILCCSGSECVKTVEVGCLRSLEFGVVQTSKLLTMGALMVGFLQILSALSIFIFVKRLIKMHSLRLERLRRMQPTVNFSNRERVR